MQAKVSIIMPSYNSSEWISRAITSIQSQELKNWELIIINDGSTDDTPAILDDFSKSDERIVVVHQPNQGVAASRQKGIDLAHGEYIIHIDSDDWVEADFLSTMYKVAKEKDADMVWCDIYINEDCRWSIPCEENSDAMIREIMKQRIWGSLWNRLFRTSICKARNVSFPKECSMWEDMAFVVQCLTYCKNIVHVTKPLYHYRQVQSSLVHTQSHKDISAEYRKAIDHIERFLASVGKLDKYKLEIRSLQLFAIRDFIDDKRFADYDKFLNTYPDAINHISEYDYPNRLKISAWLLQHGLGFGVPFVCKVDAGFRRLGLSKQM